MTSKKVPLLTLTWIFFIFYSDVMQGSPTGEKPESLLQNVPELALLNEVIKLAPKEKHHFNLEAPQKCGALNWLIKNPSHLECQITKPGTHKIQVSICDDQKTFCKIEKFDLIVKGGNPSTQKELSQKAESAFKPNELGFYENDLKKAIATSKKQKKLLLIDFSAKWCPPCNHLEETVFVKPEFKEATKTFVKVKVDVDTEAAWAWMDQYKIHWYPTLVVANSKGDEIGRSTDAQSLKKTLDWIKEQEANKSLSLKQAVTLLKKKTPPENLKKRVGIWEYENKNYKQAVTCLQGLQDSKAKMYALLSQFELAKKEGNAAKQNHIQETLLKDFSDQYSLLSDWALELQEKDPVTAKPYLEQAIKTLTSLENKNGDELEALDMSFTALYWNIADLYDALTEKAKAKAYYLKTAAMYEQEGKTSYLKLARGANLRRAQVLMKAEKFDEAKAIYQSLAQEYKNEFTFNFNYARALLKLKEYKNAKPYATLALENSYGQNLLRATCILAEIEVNLGEKQKAKVRIEKTLDEVRLPKSIDTGPRYAVDELKRVLKLAQN